jgi:hypothetical protein
MRHPRRRTQQPTGERAGTAASRTSGSTAAVRSWSPAASWLGLLSSGTGAEARLETLGALVGGHDSRPEVGGVRQIQGHWSQLSHQGPLNES